MTPRKRTKKSSGSKNRVAFQFFILGILAGIIIFGIFLSIIWSQFTIVEGRTDLSAIFSDKADRGLTLPFQAQVSEPQNIVSEDKKVVRVDDVDDPTVSSEAVLLYDPTSKQILYEKNASMRWPTASIAKLMTATVILDTLELEGDVEITTSDIDTEGVAGDLLTGEIITLTDLLHVLLIPSSNDAASALANTIDNERFISLMNRKASQFGMIQTRFAESSGLDAGNISTAWDLARLLMAIEDRELIWDILKKPTAVVYSRDGRAHYLTSTNKLLGEEGFIVAKTGYTTQSGENYAAFLESPREDQALVLVLLGSDDRLVDARAMRTWLLEAYKWNE